MKPFKPSALELKLAKMSFGYKQRKELYSQLMSLLRTGMQTTDAIRMSWDVASLEGKKPNETTAIVLYDVIQSMQNGNSLGQSLKPWVPQEDVMIFEAIANSSDFVGNLKEYMEMMEKKKAIKGSIVGGLAYPVLLVGMVIGIMVYFGTSIVPQIAGLLPMENWTGAASFLRFMNDFAMSYVTPLLIFLAATIAIIVAALPRWAGGFRIIADKLPIFSTYRMYTGISFLMSMASLLQGGMPPVDALDRLHPQANPYIKYRILRVRNQMLDGNNLGAALYKAGTGWPDTNMNLNIKIFAETQDLSGQLSTLAKSWIDQAQQGISKTMAAIRTLAMIMVFFVIMGIVGGVFALQDQIAASVR